MLLQIEVRAHREEQEQMLWYPLRQRVIGHTYQEGDGKCDNSNSLPS